MGLDQGDVVYEDRSRNTFENALFTRDLVKPKEGERWLLVTSAMHMPRAVGVFRKVGFPVIAYPVDFRTNGEFWRAGVPGDTGSAVSMVENAMHEWLGLIAYRLTGKTDALFPAPSFPFRLNRKNSRFFYFVVLSEGETGVRFCRKHSRAVAEHDFSLADPAAFDLATTPMFQGRADLGRRPAAKRHASFRETSRSPGRDCALRAFRTNCANEI